MCRVPSLHCRADCSGAWGGSKALDQCTVCGGRNACADCKGWPNGGNLTDNCGKCDDSPKNDCKPDCAAVWGGSKQASFLLAPSLFFVLKTLVFIEKVCRRTALLLRRRL